MHIQIFILINFFGMAMGNFNLLISHLEGLNSSWTGTDANGGSVLDPDIAEYGGVVRLKMVMDYEAQKHIDAGGHVLKLNPGGTLGCNPAFNVISKKNPEIAAKLDGEFVNALGFDAMCPGNHEFDLGVEGWNEYMRKAGKNTDKDKLYLVYEADCYRSEAEFQADNDATKWPEKIDFTKSDSYNVDYNVPIFVGANFIENEYFAQSVIFDKKKADAANPGQPKFDDPEANKPKIPIVKMRRSVVRIFKTPIGNVPVGIIGYLTPDTKHKTEKRFNDLNDKVLIIGNEVAYVEKESKRLKQMGVDIIIALGFSGLEKDKEIATLPFISAVIGGFTCTFMYNHYGELETKPDDTVLSYPVLIPKYTTGDNFGFTPIAHTLSNMKYLGQLKLEFNKLENWNLILNDHCSKDEALSTFTYQNQNPIVLNGKIKNKVELRQSCPMGSYRTASSAVQLYDGMKLLLNKWISAFNDELKTSNITITEYRQIGKFIEGGEICRKKDCEMGSVIADSHLHWYQSVKSALPDIQSIADIKECPYAIGVINAGAVRAHIGDKFTSPTKQKSVTTYEIIQILTGNSPVVVIQMTMEQVIKMFQYSISQWKDYAPSGRLLHVSSNVRVTYDFKDVKTTTVHVEGKDVLIPKDITVEMLHEGNWTNITSLPYTSYRVVTTQHLHEGRTGYEVIKQGKKMKSTDQKVVEEFGQKVLADYLSDTSKFNPSSYQPRTTFMNKPLMV